MLEFLCYQRIPGGKLYLSNDEQYLDLLGVSAQSAGCFEVKAVGQKPEVGQFVRVPIKGSKQMSLIFTVNAVQDLITPAGAWSAQCRGPAQLNFQLKTAEICCDACAEKTELEFVHFSNDAQADAVLGMELAGWQASLQQQICPKCVARGEV